MSVWLSNPGAAMTLIKCGDDGDQLQCCEIPKDLGEPLDFTRKRGVVAGAVIRYLIGDT
jgi:hypothetical protein